MKNRMMELWSKNQAKVWIFGDQGLVSGVNFTIGILLARFLGIETFGLFSLAWMVLFFSSSIQQAFLTAPLFALTPKQENPAQWIAQLYFIQILFSVLSFFIVVAIVESAIYLNPTWNFNGISITLGLLVAVYLFNDFSRRVLFTTHQPKKVVFIDVYGYALQPLIVIALYGLDLLSLQTALAAILGAQLLSLGYIIIRIRPTFIFQDIKNTAATLWTYSRFLLATALLQWSSANYIILFAASILGPAVIGAIKVAQNLMGVLNVLFQAMENIIPVRSAEAYHRGGIKALGIYMQKTTIQFLTPVALVLILVGIFHQQIMTTIYGDEYLQYSFVLLAFCGIYILVFLGTLLRFIIRTLEYNQIIFWSYVFTTVFSLIAGKVLATDYGLTGVLVGIAGTQIISFISFITFLKFKVKWNFRLYTLS
ncbi:hypothetical protein GYB57_04700 [bacterium]|nr:hypothetical protein [bacterium]